MESQRMGFPYWVQRTLDNWKFYMKLIDGTKIVFGTTQLLDGDREWVNLLPTDNLDEEDDSGFIHPNPRGYLVRLDQVISFWEMDS